MTVHTEDLKNGHFFEIKKISFVKYQAINKCLACIMQN